MGKKTASVVENSRDIPYLYVGEIAYVISYDWSALRGCFTVGSIDGDQVYSLGAYPKDITPYDMILNAEDFKRWASTHMTEANPFVVTTKQFGFRKAER